jgi:two-component sensor histidine kinase
MVGSVRVVRPFLFRWRLEPGSTEAYAFAVSCVAIASLMRWGLGLISDDVLPFPTFYPAVLFAALIGGLYAGMLAATLGGLIGWAFMLPHYVFLPLTLGRSISLATYLIASITIILGAEHYRRLLTRLEAEEELRKLVVDELAHRLKNKIATIQAIISSRLRDNPQARDAILGLLASLSATDDLIMSTQGEGAYLKDILKAEVGPYDSSRISMQGPDVLLPPKLAMTMALVVHELTTNAAKYGALATPTGRLDIAWSLSAREMTFRWQESGGPAISLSGYEGFGTRLLPRALAPFGGNVKTKFEPAGLICEMSVNMGTAKKLGSTDLPRLVSSRAEEVIQ